MAENHAESRTDRVSVVLSPNEDEHDDDDENEGVEFFYTYPFQWLKRIRVRLLPFQSSNGHNSLGHLD